MPTGMDWMIKQKIRLHTKADLIVFFKMLKELELRYDCIVIKHGIRKLPKIGRCKRHTVSDDFTPRCWTVVSVAVGKAKFYLFEVDMSDATKPLSTKGIIIASASCLMETIEEFESKLLQSSLSWPKPDLDAFRGADNHFFIVHPATKTAGQILAEHNVRWARSVFRNLLKHV